MDGEDGGKFGEQKHREKHMDGEGNKTDEYEGGAGR